MGCACTRDVANPNKRFTMAIDSNNDGQIDTWYHDTKGTGHFDVIEEDTNGDGKVDTIMKDTSGTTKPYTIFVLTSRSSGFVLISNSFSNFSKNHVLKNSTIFFAKSQEI